MYICDNCNNVFEEPARVVFDDHPELDGYKEYKSGCPYCKSPYIDDVYICDKCGEYIPASIACFEGDGVFCEDCLSELDEDEEDHARFDIFNELDKIFTKALERSVAYGNT